MKTAEAIHSAISITIQDLPVFRGSYAIIALSLNGDSHQINYTQQHLTPEIISAYGPDLIPFAVRKATAEASAWQISRRSLHQNYAVETSNQSPFHNGASRIDSFYFGVSGALPSPQILEYLNIDPNTPIPNIPHQGFFDHLLAQQITTRLHRFLPTDIPLPAYLRWIQNNCPGQSEKVGSFLDFNQ